MKIEVKTYVKQSVKLSMLFIISFTLVGCTHHNASTNKELPEPSPPYSGKAQFTIKDPRTPIGDKNRSLVILALSGGGSRAAILSSNVMFELENVFDGLNILKEVDVISSVSGGSLAAAYYAISYDVGTGDLLGTRYWEVNTVNRLMAKNYMIRWFGNWYWPNNIAKYWFTAYDRSDIMAKTLADNLFDNKFNGFDYEFSDINPERPYLIINSTNGTTPSKKGFTENEFSKVFTFTSDDFEAYTNSDINKYSISRAVMASASFPAVFNFMTLRNFHEKNEKHYLHVFDGGNADNLGLVSVKRVIRENIGDYDRIIVILVDASTGSLGVSSKKADSRSLISFFVDTNFLDSSNSLLENNRINSLTNFKSTLHNLIVENKISKNKTIFYHIEINDMGTKFLRNQLKAIGTDFRITKQDARSIREAVNCLIVSQNICLQDIRDILLEGEARRPGHTVNCTWEDSETSTQACLDTL